MSKFLQSIFLSIAPMIIGALTYVFVDVVTLRADYDSMKREGNVLSRMIIERLDRLEDKIDKLYEK